MDSYLHQAWTNDTKEKVAEAILSIISNKSVLNLLFEKSKDEEMKSLIKSKMSDSNSSNKSSKKEDPIIEDDLIFKSESNDSTSSKEKSHIEEDSSSDDEYDELFQNL
jgi:hypothetical protein